jgi:hypothetical protein
MLFEYAVEPSALAGWDKIRRLHEAFGVGEGRLISKFPKTWERRVLDACLNLGPTEKMRITELLVRIKEKNLVKTKRPYFEGESWVDNVLRANSSEPFHAILAESEFQHAQRIGMEEVLGDNPLWAVPMDGIIRRTASEIARIAAPLLLLSGEVVFVDPYFSSRNHLAPLIQLLNAARKGKALNRIEYHLAGEMPALEFQNDLTSVKRCLNLNGESVLFVRWHRQSLTEKQHARYVLTNRGGIRFDYGLDEGGGSTDWSRLGESLWKQRKSEYEPETSPYTLADAWKVGSGELVQVIWNGKAWVPV